MNEAVSGTAADLRPPHLIRARSLTRDNVTVDPIARFKKAFSDDDAAALRQLFIDHPELKARVNEPLFPFDSPAITYAASYHKIGIIDALLEAGANINARSSWWAGGFGVLDHDNHEIVPHLIERGAIVDAYAAAKHGMMDRLRELIDRNPELVHARGGDGQAPLHVAFSVEIAQLLLDRGADINARDIDHESTPAQYLVRSNPEIVRFLIDRGCTTDILLAAAVGDLDLVRRHLDADPESIRTRVNAKYFPMQNPRAGGSIYIWTLGQNRSAHQVARSFQHENVLHLLLERTPEDLRLAQACLTGDSAWVEAALARYPEKVRALAQANPSYVSDAAEDNDATAVRLMLECGWPVEGDGRHTPLHWACWHGNAEMARQILRFHPPLEFQDADYHGTPLGWALYGSEHGWNSKTGEYGATVKALLAAGARPPEKVEGSPAVREVLRGNSPA